MESRTVMALGLLLIVQCQVQAEPANQRERPRVAVLFCDKVGLDESSRITLRKETIRILASAGIDLTWGEATGGLDTPTSFNLISSESCQPPSDFQFHFSIVLSRESTKRAPMDAMGFAKTTPSRRVYVLYERVRAKVLEYARTGSAREDTAIVLGNVIAHEVGHLLLPGEGHSKKGIMSEGWGMPQIQDAISGALLFQADQAKRIQARFR